MDDATERATVPVLAAVIERAGRYLLGRRPSAKRHGGAWEFPGGKLEPGEALLDAARRELGEELGVEVERAGTAVFEAADPDSPFRILFVPVEIAGEPRCLEHDELRWLSPDELAGLELAPADRAFARALLAGGRSG